MKIGKAACWGSRKIDKAFLDNIYLVLFALLVFDKFLVTTVFGFTYPIIIKLFIRILLAVYFLVKFWDGYRLSKYEMIFIVLLSGTAFLTWLNAGNYEIMDIALLAAGAHNIKFDKILKTYIALAIPFVVLTVAASQAGLVENLVYHRGTTTRMAFGFVYPTDFMAHIFFVALVWCVLRNVALTYWELLVLVLLAIFSYIFCDARMNEFCLMLTAAVFLIMKIWNEKAGTTHKKEKIEACLGRLLIWGTVFCGTVITFMTWLYDSSNPVWRKLDALISQRLRLGKLGFDQFGISLFGQELPIVGMGTEKVWPENYFFLDSSYVKVLLEYGVVLFLIVLLMFTINAYRAYKEKRYYLLLALSLMAFQCVIEHHMLEIAYNPFLFMIFTDITDHGSKVAANK